MTEPYFDGNCVVYPAVPAVPPTPARVDFDSFLGWDAGATSIEQVARNAVRARAQFGQAVGIVFGFCDPGRIDSTNPADIEFGWYVFTQAGETFAQAIERGVPGGPVVAHNPVATYDVRRASGRVSFWQGGARVHTSARRYYGPVRAGCALYASGDEITDAALTSSLPLAGEFGAELVAPGGRCDGLQGFATFGLLVAPGPTLSGRYARRGALRAPGGEVFGAHGGSSWGNLIAPLALVSGSTGGIPTPSARIGLLAAPLAVLDGTGSSHHSVDVDIEPAGASLRGYPGANVGDMVAPGGQLFGGVERPLTHFLYLEAGPAYAAMWVGVHTEQVAERMRLADLATISSWVIRLRERFGLAATTDSLLDAAVRHSEPLVLVETLRIVWRVVMGETLALADDAAETLWVMRRIVDTLVLSGVAAHELEAHIAISQTFALADQPDLSWHAAIREAFTLNEDLGERITAIARVIERLDLGDTLTPSMIAAAVIEESMALTDSAGTALEASVVLRESLRLLVRVVVNGNVYSAWVINTESKGVSRFTNYPFNSFAKLDGVDIGATSTGLYRLDAADDDGEPIPLRIRSGLTDLGTRVAKRVPEMYLGYRADGHVVLKVITTSENGSKTEDWYRLEPRKSQDVRESRFKIGRGLKSVYWGWELCNVDGADLEIDTIEWRPLQLSRRLT